MVNAKLHTFTTCPGGAQSGSHAGAVGDACNRSYRIGLLEHCGTGNLGDDATVEAALQQLRRRWPHASIIGLSRNPPDTEQRLKINSFPRRPTVIDIEKQWPCSARAPPVQSSFRARLQTLVRKRPFARCLARCRGMLRGMAARRAIMAQFDQLFPAAAPLAPAHFGGDTR